MTKEPPEEATAFDRVADEMKQAWRENGGEPSLADSLEWLAHKVRHADESPGREPLSAFDRTVEEMKQGVRENGGSSVFAPVPYLGRLQEEE